MKTVTIQIGNSDDKLTQGEWSAFVEAMRALVSRYCYHTHFAGGSPVDAPWQNYCFIGEFAPNPDLKPFQDEVTKLRKIFKQDSVAVTVGTTAFI